MGIPRIIGAGALALLTALPAWAEAPAERLAQALLLDQVADVLRAEGLRYGQGLDQDMLGGAGGSYFAGQVARLYDVEVMYAVLRDHLASGMSEAEIDESLTFFEAASGKRILELEVSARLAMADPAVEEAALAAAAEARAADHPRMQDVRAFDDLNDLTERNVAGALSSNYQFFLGLADGGGNRMSEDEILSEVWSQEEDIRKETGAWLAAFLFMAYGPLEPDEMRAYLEYSDTGAGQALNAALFDGFDELYRTIYYALGLAVARSMQGSDL